MDLVTITVFAIFLLVMLNQGWIVQFRQWLTDRVHGS